MPRKFLIASLAVGLAFLTACSQPAAPVAPASSGASAPATPAAAGSATATPTPAAGSAVDDFLTKMGEGQAAVKTFKINMKTKTAVNGTDVSMTMKGVVDQTDSSDIDISATMTVAGMKMKMIKVDGAMYMQMAATGKKWIKLPESQMAQFEGSTRVDYAAQFAKAKDSIESVEVVGQETVGGVPTSHYRIVLDADALAKMSGNSDQSYPVTSDTFNYDVWLDDANRPRRITMSLTVEAGGKKMPMSIQSVMSDYNKPVTITAPPKSQIQG